MNLFSIAIATSLLSMSFLHGANVSIVNKLNAHVTVTSIGSHNPQVTIPSSESITFVIDESEYVSNGSLTIKITWRNQQYSFIHFAQHHHDVDLEISEHDIERQQLKITIRDNQPPTSVNCMSGYKRYIVIGILALYAISSLT